LAPPPIIAQFGMAGAFAALVKGMLCNWIVTLGVVPPYTSRSVIGKAIATFVPIYMFFGMGFEHMVVNQFIIPTAMLFGAPISTPLMQDREGVTDGIAMTIRGGPTWR
jgi:formate/nitrite transporter FocA (FNT family)